MNALQENHNKNIIKRGTSSEKEIADAILSDFNAKKSKAFKLLKLTSIDDIDNISLGKLCYALSICIEQKIPRNYKRRKELMIKWIDDYYDLCLKYIKYIKIEVDVL